MRVQKELQENMIRASARQRAEFDWRLRNGIPFGIDDGHAGGLGVGGLHPPPMFVLTGRGPHLQDPRITGQSSGILAPGIDFGM